ncbi:inositol 2-dehydrogenase [Metabacillus litoralis]|jgi:scyllo-inositol 2-dehydrogenase (NAD+)|uniref:inositol 2-dehydrogenase n=1 Tax=Metabacillus litoralis TaxID=152268 RepID=UPI00203E1D7F|nr:inositol 2-dehydrogenase [Metabacillus litoralis]MCM3652280.1 inositol 2-dehydrogenase [Metabacillus litoralis]
MKEKIRCAVIGVGRLGYWHAENLATRIKGAELVTIVSSRKESAEKVARELGVKKWTNNPQEIFEDPSIDAVVIVTPTKTHAELIIQAARSKKHIFVDKPLTETLEEAEMVIQEINKNNVFCQVGFMRRFDPAYAEAKRRIENGDIGQPIYFKGLSRDPGSPPEDYIKTSGGIFLDLCIHEYDIARFLMGDEVKSVKAFGDVLIHPFMNKYQDVDQSMTFMTFKNGASCDIEGSRNSSFGYDIRGEVIGTEGTIQIGSLQHHDIKILTSKGSAYDNVPNFPIKFKESFLNELSHFIECLQKNERPQVSEIDGKIALEIAEAATKSFKTKETVVLN